MTEMELAKAIAREANIAIAERDRLIKIQKGVIGILSVALCATLLTVVVCLKMM